MSFKAFVWAWGQPLEKDEHLIVLLAIADISNEAAQLWASHAYIARHARRNERTVRRALMAMDGGPITITERPGRTDLITLNIPATFTVTFERETEELRSKVGRPRKTLAKVSETLSPMVSVNPGLRVRNPPPMVSPEPIGEPEDGTFTPSDEGDAHEVEEAFGDEPIEKPVAAPKPAKRASRISPDWQPDMAIATGFGLSLEQALWEADAFRDYWLAKAGSGALKMDWTATWRSWCRTTAKRMGRGGAFDGRGPTGTGADGRRAERDDRVGSMLEGAMEALERSRGER